jgi:hypothetical protein
MRVSGEKKHITIKMDIYVYNRHILCELYVYITDMFREDMTRVWAEAP